MTVFAHQEFDDHEQVVFCRNREAGLSAIIAIHSSALGPAVGGLRVWPYADPADALTDVLRLSRGMTYKAAITGLSLGGGKAVIIGDPRRAKTRALLTAFGRFVDGLGGRYVVGEDVGTSVADMDVIAGVTRHVAGTSGGVGDPSPYTAWGVFQAIRAALHHKTGRDAINGLVVAVQGVGNVGFELCRLLREAGTELVVADLSDAAVRKAQSAFGATAVSPDALLRQRCDVLAPCALGAILNDATIPELKAKIVAGSANNQLAAPRHAARLAERGILYVPDYVANAGGVIAIAQDGAKADRTRCRADVARIYDRLLDLLKRSAQSGRPPAEIADALVRERLAAAPAAGASSPPASALKRTELQPTA